MTATVWSIGGVLMYSCVLTKKERKLVCTSKCFLCVREIQFRPVFNRFRANHQTHINFLRACVCVRVQCTLLNHQGASGFYFVQHKSAKDSQKAKYLNATSSTAHTCTHKKGEYGTLSHTQIHFLVMSIVQ